MHFVNSYDFSDVSRFYKVISIEKSSGSEDSLQLAIGGVGLDGLLVLVASDGSVVWSRQYRVGNATVRFLDAIWLPDTNHDGTFVVLGSLKSGKTNNFRYLVTQISIDGNVLFEREYSTNETIEPKKILLNKSAELGYVLIGASLDSSTNKKSLERLDIAVDGKPKKFVKFNLPDDFVFEDSISTSRGLIVVGNNANSEPIGSIITMDYKFEYNVSYSFEKPKSDIKISLGAVSYWGDQIVIAGQVGFNSSEDNNVFVCKLGIDDRYRLSILSSKTYSPLDQNADRLPAKILSVSESLLVLEQSWEGDNVQSIARLDSSLDGEGRYSFDFEVAQLNLLDIISSPNGHPIISGGFVDQKSNSFLLTTDLAFECCKTNVLNKPITREIDVSLSVSKNSVTSEILNSREVVSNVIVVEPKNITIASLCNRRIESGSAERLLQSPYLHLQTAGSDGTEASRGNCLRWFLTGELGKSHIPKGKLASTDLNFNKSNDFVKIYRASWNTVKTFSRTLSLEKDEPVHIESNIGLFVFEKGSKENPSLFYVRFLNTSAFQSAQNGLDLKVDLPKIIDSYLSADINNVIEVELRSALSVCCNVVFDFKSETGLLKIETISAPSDSPVSDKIVSSRHALSSDTNSKLLFADNIRAVRFSASNLKSLEFNFCTYLDMFDKANSSKSWVEIGKFGLTTDDQTAFRRLEEDSRFIVHDNWKKFQGDALVNIDNYHDRWFNYLSDAVEKYVEFSDNPGAQPAEEGENGGGVNVSYFDMMQLTMLDYHVARMFGMAHIDTLDLESSESHIYLAEYFTEGDLADGRGKRDVHHLFMSLPTSILNSRSPFLPEVNSIEYGLDHPTASAEIYKLTDDQGYTSDGQARYVRFSPKCYPLYSDDQTFFATDQEFSLYENSIPVCYGVKYRHSDSVDWDSPDIAHDDKYKDTNGIEESVPTPFPPISGERPFVHKETKEGFHEYSVYGINIFSRSSDISNSISTDETKFSTPNRLLPPSDLAVQLIQKEDPVVLTTEHEQEMFSEIETTADTTLVRLTFNYGNVQDAAHAFADHVEIFYRQEPPSSIVGGVDNVQVSNNHLRIASKPYLYLSTGETVTPIVESAENFIGGAIVVGEYRFNIVDIEFPDEQLKENPVFIVEKQKAMGVEETEFGNVTIIEDTTPNISENTLVMAIENMASFENWGSSNPLSMKIQLGSQSWKDVNGNWKTETEVVENGINEAKTIRELRGIWDTAEVIDITDSQTIYNSEETEVRIYSINFDQHVLLPHSQENVYWHKGIVRLSVIDQQLHDRRTLKVITVSNQSNGRLSLTAIDDSGKSSHVQTGSSLTANYYPGYKVYLLAEEGVFDSTRILPSTGEGNRTSILSVRSVQETSDEDLLYSGLSIPQVLLAQEIIEPGKPRKPSGVEYATPPDNYGKSTYTLTVEFESEPYSVIFCRADALSILRSLYDSSTVLEIRNKLLPPDKHEAVALIWNELLDFENYPETLTFSTFVLEDEEIALPHPNSSAFIDHEDTVLSDLKDKIKEEILKVFLPLTEQPIIYGLVRDDANYIPVGKKQTFRNSNGDILKPGEDGFDLAPMAKRYFSNETPALQFTDFTLDGAMNPNTAYFYFARELGNRMKLGEPSEIFGPVKLVNLSAPATPVVRSLIITPFNIETTMNPNIQLNVIAPSVNASIKYCYVYRAFSSLDTVSVRTMTLAKVIDLSQLEQDEDGTVVISDDFSDLAIIPYGQPLYYRLCFVREVIYKDDNGDFRTEVAESIPTRVFLTNLVDIVNPVPPKPELTILGDTGEGEKFIQLNWSKTVHNGTYYVNRLSASGTWIRVGEISSNEDLISFDLPVSLPVYDEDENLMYHRFKIDVQNSSGLVNLIDSPITSSLDSH